GGPSAVPRAPGLLNRRDTVGDTVVHKKRSITGGLEIIDGFHSRDPIAVFVQRSVTIWVFSRRSDPPNIPAPGIYLRKDFQTLRPQKVLVVQLGVRRFESGQHRDSEAGELSIGHGVGGKIF